jgi:hypothetical protein
LPVTIDIYNYTNASEQLHWHGQKLPSDVDGTVQVRMSEAYDLVRHKVLTHMKNAD